VGVVAVLAIARRARDDDELARVGEIADLEVALRVGERGSLAADRGAEARGPSVAGTASDMTRAMVAALLCTTAVKTALMRTSVKGDAGVEATRRKTWL